MSSSRWLSSQGTSPVKVKEVMFSFMGVYFFKPYRETKPDSLSATLANSFIPCMVPPHSADIVA
ncbi:hypothetical protein [Endozoicomonas sp. GU-1]|uniref:hypothetical protein n=1 Tax=Endozoicomonas sp. GU-1 TaxID=3009078 RepID=UPI0022B42B67|nr:hypothetical protein [Endozoicomonas sp. GU-1]WBA81431.1 hypothetical protein O2T12_24665 [Endozoicomonas sp. GU-1]